MGSQRKTPWKTLFTTYSSLHKLADALNQLYPRAKNDINGGGVVDFAVFDETHKMEGLGSGSSSSGQSDTTFSTDSTLRFQQWHPKPALRFGHAQQLYLDGNGSGSISYQTGAERRTGFHFQK
jgi:hypothetical protein